MRRQVVRAVLWILTQHEKLNHQIDVTSGVLGQQCSEKLSSFFKRRRAEIKAAKKAARSQD